MAWRRIRQATAEDRASLTAAAERFAQRHGIPRGLYTPVFTVEDWASRDKRLRRSWLGVVSRTLTPSFAEGIRDGWVGYEVIEEREPKRARTRTTG